MEVLGLLLCFAIQQSEAGCGDFSMVQCDCSQNLVLYVLETVKK